MRHRGIVAVFAGLVAFSLAIALIIYFDPFTSILDKVFVEQEDPPLSNVEYISLWHGDGSNEALPELKAIIDRYFECFYSALGDREFEGERVMEGFFLDSCDDAVYSLAAMSSCAGRLSASAVNLSLSGVRVHIWLDSVVKINKDGYIFTLNQSAELMYEALSGISGGEGIYTHTFIFERIGGNWYLSSHECYGGAWGYGREAMKALLGTSSPSYEQLHSAYPFFVKNLTENIESGAELIKASGYGANFPEAQTAYNRSAAVEYALRWSSILNEVRNTEVWWNYDNDSGNFISQCIFSGVGQMDTRGNFIWKWFGENVNYSEETEGCSMSWTEGDNFWLYCTGNDRRGLCTYTDIAGGQLEKGDIVQLITADKVASQVIVTDTVTDIRGKKLDYLVCGHDDDLVNYPLSALHCDKLRFIKILGYNKD